MRLFWILFSYEWRHFRAAKGLVLMCGLLLATGLYGIYYGTTEMARQRQHLAALPELTRRNVAELKVKFPGPADAGEIGYYHTTFAVHHPDPWAALSLGLRDVNPNYVKLRLLGLQNQLYATDNTNPMKVLSGNFDLAFVLVYLFPLLIIALSFNLLSSEREEGILVLLLAQPVRPAVVVGAKLAFRLALVLGLALLLSAVGMAWAGVPLDGRVATWLALTVLYCLFWLGAALVVTALQRPSAVNAVVLLGVWLLLVLLVPSLLNLGVAAARPVPQGIELTIRQREEIHAGWDRPKAQTMNRFFARYPQWRDTATIRERFVWRWYYAFQHLGDLAVAPQAAAYAHGLQQRYNLVEQLNILSPAINMQSSFNALAGSDLPTHLAFQRSATRYHDSLRAFYYPFLFQKVGFTHADYAREPTHTFTSPPELATARHGLLKLLLSVAAVFGLGAVLLRLRPVNPR
jgi:ABC-2 type transport system permease protein